jgi:two-component system sensor histidine kinase/response regulator
MAKTRVQMQQEIDMLRQEIKVAREAAEITAEFVVRQFEQTENMLHRFQIADAERQAVLDAATQLSIIATDLDGTIRLFSKGASTLLGYKSAEMVGLCNIISLHLPENLAHYGQTVSGVPGSSLHDMMVFDQFVKQKHSRVQEWTYVCKDGTHLPVNLSITSLANLDGGVAGYLFTAMDLTIQKKMARELIEAKEAAEAANASRGDFLARMSHEIRTPMNGIIGMGTLLQKTALDDRQQNYVDKLLSSANTLLGLLNDILDFSKIDAGRMQLENIPFNLDNVFTTIGNAVGMQVERKGLEFLFQIDPRIPSKLLGDPLRLGQILMNLTGNAVKFTEHGEILIKAELASTHDDHLTLQFSVRDSGIGLSEEQIAKLFSAFSQADDSITRKYGGTGLGLAICKQLTELMGGRIWVESTPGKGAEFFFTARLRAVVPEDGEKPRAPQIFQGLRALVVDDNEIARDILSSMLASLGFAVETAHDGLAALQCLEEAVQANRPFDIVLLDWIMPGIDGIETARRIKANKELTKVPAMLMVTANGREEAFFKAAKVGLDAFLLKPVYASVMFNTLQEVLGLESMPRSANVRTRSQQEDFSTLRGARILLVDDNSINREVATEFLRDAGMIVTVATDGEKCLEVLAGEDFDLILMDIQMPELDGLEATRRIRTFIRYADLPIIAMTAHAMTGDREKSLAAGMNDHITKPLNPQDLYRTLRRWLTPGTTSTATASTGLEEKESGKKVAWLPDLPGIDLQEALNILGNKQELLLKMLHEFRRNNSLLPTRLRELSQEGNWPEIQHWAHTIKGVAGYLGAKKLQQTSEGLETALSRGRQEDSVVLLVEFIDSLDSVLSALAELPPIPGKSKPHPDRQAAGSATPSEVEKHLQTLIEHLHKGEFAAEEQFSELAELLTGTGYDDRLEIICDLIEDVEYESAAEQSRKLLELFRQNVE